VGQIAIQVTACRSRRSLSRTALRTGRERRPRRGDLADGPAGWSSPTKEAPPRRCRPPTPRSRSSTCRSARLLDRRLPHRLRAHQGTGSYEGPGGVVNAWSPPPSLDPVAFVAIRRVTRPSIPAARPHAAVVLVARTPSRFDDLRAQECRPVGPTRWDQVASGSLGLTAFSVGRGLTTQEPFCL
jgi:hypothetical protein